MEAFAGVGRCVDCCARHCLPPLFCVSFLNKLVSPNQQHNFSFRITWQRFMRRSTTLTRGWYGARFFLSSYLFFFRAIYSRRCHRCRRTHAFNSSVRLFVAVFFFFSNFHIQSFEILLARQPANYYYRAESSEKHGYSFSFQATKKMPWVKSFWVQSFVIFFFHVYIFIYSSLRRSVLTALLRWMCATVHRWIDAFARFTCQRELSITETTEEKYALETSLICIGYWPIPSH